MSVISLESYAGNGNIPEGTLGALVTHTATGDALAELARAAQFLPTVRYWMGLHLALQNAKSFCNNIWASLQLLLYQGDIMR